MEPMNKSHKKRVCCICAVRATHRLKMGHDKYEYFCALHIPVLNELVFGRPVYYEVVRDSKGKVLSIGVVPDAQQHERPVNA